ncbi:Dipeptide transport system permease protein DppC [Pseudonocardia sp. Ae406_Ps2]|uniref:ABC transporter permease n=1 Tax=unclassified Pseudonocardia TaxID=2619320 RepID=UPI00030D3265|nr:MULTISPECIES: ABC transporter permease [unclassified Pseudonocardia]OLM01956.1 Dipeptide transport system permease protein DppC [Pseudonocardia sp. Ae406_Ps2]OLM06257.1 Dipeptide transport system permease protein DppC [Pseudonocardia sp. Ae331_Ps2]OLM12996.1 Dipeptide transport system permease protein DppC [Pseudonocardia sp. Ae505_Ps2]OLM23532.1 Dipeptide transport system permease protein DppC [Pseudonocardia sp. Ae706_Ps2]OLM32576.1 Dipeptide transport system permease protein DppC [Pseudo
MSAPALTRTDGAPEPDARAARTRRWAPPTVLASFVVVALVLAWAVAPGLFTSHDPVDGIPSELFRPPGAGHLLGTDQLGRDVFARIVHGTASSVTSALVAVAIGVLVGGAIGLLAGFLGGLVDVVLARLVDVLLAIPSFLLAVVIVSALGFQTINAAVATGISAIAVFARVMRSEVLKTRSAVYVEAALLLGGSRWHVLLRHVLPNASRSVLQLAVLQFGLSVLVIASLAFLGYGDPPPASDWGLLVATGKDYPLAPWLVWAPALVTIVTVLSVNRISRWLRTTD